MSSNPLASPSYDDRRSGNERRSLGPGAIVGRRARRARCVGALLALSLCGAPGPARADDPPKAADSLIAPAEQKSGPSQEDMERARHAYGDGEAAYRLNHFDEAAKQYEDAYRIMKLPTMLYDVAQAWRRQYEVDKNIDHARRSVELYRGFIRDAPLAKQRASAEKFITLLESQIAANSKEPKGHDLYTKGRLAFQVGRYGDAIAAFEASYALDHTNETLWQIGLACVREYGIRPDSALLRRARDVFANFAEQSTRAEDKAKAAEQQEAIAKLLAEAQAAAAATPPAAAPPAAALDPTAAAPRETPKATAPAPVATATSPGPPAPTPVYKKWWLWTVVVIGVAAIGAGAGLGVALSGPQQAPFSNPSAQTITVGF